MKEKNNASIGIDVGGTNIRIGLVDNNLECYHVIKYKTENVGNKFNDYVIEYVNKHLGEFNITSISIGFPGVVNDFTKEIIEVPNAKFLESKTQILDLQQVLGIPVNIDNDTNHLIMYDMHDNNINDKDNVLGFYIGTGFGFAMVLNKKIFYGDQLYAGELGHIPVFKDELGNYVGLENKTAGVYLKELAKNKFNLANLDDLFTKYGNDPDVLRVVERISVSIASVLIVLNVSHVIMGGGIVHMPGFPLDMIQEKVRGFIKNENVRNNLKFYLQKESDEAGIIGAYLLSQAKNNKTS